MAGQLSRTAWQDGDAIGMGGWRCYWHGRTAKQDSMAGQLSRMAWEDSMGGQHGRTAKQDGVGGQRCYWHGRMGGQDSDENIE